MRFTFGTNWTQFSQTLDAARVAEAEESLTALLAPQTLRGRSLLDIGSGSGLFSIAAVRLGAARVVAVDRDADCVTIAGLNAARFLDAEQRRGLTFRRGDVLDPVSLGPDVYDVVYAWGSLHHTGRMWQAVENAASRCAPGGVLVLALYNRTRLSPAWLRIKRLYHRAPRWAAMMMAGTLAASRVAARTIRGRNPLRTDRGMSVWYDAVDWLGGLPYEAATGDEVRQFLTARGFEACREVLTTRSGCNEFVFRKVTS